MQGQRALMYFDVQHKRFDFGIDHNTQQWNSQGIFCLCMRFAIKGLRESRTISCTCQAEIMMTLRRKSLLVSYQPHHLNFQTKPWTSKDVSWKISHLLFVCKQSQISPLRLFLCIYFGLLIFSLRALITLNEVLCDAFKLVGLCLTWLNIGRL